MESVKRKNISSRLMTVLIVLSFCLLYINTVVSRYGNIDLILDMGYLGENVISNMTTNKGAQVIYILIYVIIILLYIINFKKIISNKHFILYLISIFCLPYLLLKSENPLMYINSLSAASLLMAPGTVLSIGLFFLAYDEDIWIGARQGFVYIWAASILLSIFGIIKVVPYMSSTVGYIFRILALRWLWAPMIVLEFTYFICFSIIKTRWKKNIVFIISTLLLLTSAILTQTRLVIIMAFLNAIFYSIKVRNKNVLKLVILTSIIFVMIYAIGSSGVFISIGIDNFTNRLFEDTRTNSLRLIFQEVMSNPLKYFPLGGGYGNESLFTDLGYLNSIFVAGLPMVYCVTMLLYVPIIKMFKRRRNFEVETWVFASAMMWLFRSQVSSMMAFTTEFLMFILVAGHCSARLDRYSINDGSNNKNEGNNSSVRNRV